MIGEKVEWDPKALRELLACGRCKAIFDENVALLVADHHGTLTDEQAAAVHAQLQKEHDKHVQ